MKSDWQLIFDDDDKRLRMEFSPEIKERNTHWRNDDYVLVDLLIWLRSFNVSISEIRDKLNIKVIEFPFNPTTDDLIKAVLIVIQNVNFEEFNKQIDTIQDKYKLTKNWYLSLVSAVIFNTLLVPPDDIIHVHYPDLITNDSSKKDYKNNSLLKSSNLLSSPEMVRARSAYDLYEYPSIYFTRKTSPDELKKWIDTNKSLFKAIQNKLPERPVLKRGVSTLFWGKTVWIFKQDGVKDWITIQKLIDKECERIIAEQGEVNNEDLLNPPDNVALKKYYDRFVESLKKIDPN